LFKTTTGTFITHIPYRGAAQAVTGLMAGEVDMMFENLPSVLGQIQGGGVKALAVTTRQRSKALPGVPTLIESGLADFDVSAWYGVAAPAGTPAAVLARIEQALDKLSRDLEIARTMESRGAEVGFLGAAQMGAFMAADAIKWKRDVVVSVVVNAAQTESVLFGDDGKGGAASTMRPGSTFVMCSTVDPNWSVALEARLNALGLHYVDAPISGGAAKAAGPDDDDDLGQARGLCRCRRRCSTAWPPRCTAWATRRARAARSRSSTSCWPVCTLPWPPKPWPWACAKAWTQRLV
jgi:hypothetical protein